MADKRLTTRYIDGTKNSRIVIINCKVNLRASQSKLTKKRFQKES